MQVWLALYNLIMDTECRKKYQYNTSNKTELLKTRASFNGWGFFVFFEAPFRLKKQH